MDKEMYGVRVFTDNSDIIISQVGKIEIGDENRIVIHRDQIDIIIKWLNEIKWEAENNYNDASF